MMSWTTRRTNRTTLAPVRACACVCVCVCGSLLGISSPFHTVTNCRDVFQTLLIYSYVDLDPNTRGGCGVLNEGASAGWWAVSLVQPLTLHRFAVPAPYLTSPLDGIVHLNQHTEGVIFRRKVSIATVLSWSKVAGRGWVDRAAAYATTDTGSSVFFPP